MGHWCEVSPVNQRGVMLTLSKFVTYASETVKEKEGLRWRINMLEP